MKKSIIAALLIMTMPAARAEFDLEGWAWERPLALESTAPGFVRIEVTPEVFDESQASLQDLRVLGPDGNLAPHLLRWESAVSTTSLEWRDVTLLNSVFEPEVYSRVTLDFGGPIRKNLIRVQLSDTNFRRRLAIEGGSDNQNWNLIAEDQWLFDIHQEGKEFVLDTLSFPVNDFQYLRLTAYYMEDDPRRVEFQKVQSAFREVVAEKLTPVPVAALNQHLNEKTKETVIEADLGFKNLPLALIGVQTENEYFYRGVTIRGRNTTTEAVRRNTETGWEETERDTPWQDVYHGVFYRVHKEGNVSECTEAKNVQGAYRYIEIRIDNGDNPPLNISGVKAARRDASLVFESDGAGPYRLIGGNPKAASPRYDLARSMDGLGTREWPSASIGAPTRLEATEELPPWTERNAVLIWVILALCAAAMAAVVVTSLRGAKQSGDTSSGKTPEE